MKFVRSIKCWISLSMVFGCVGIGVLKAKAEADLTADEIIRRTVAHSQKTREGMPDFNCTKVSLTEELDESGKVTERREKVYSISARKGSIHANLLTVNGQAPSAKDRQKQAENELSLQKLLGQSKGSRSSGHEDFLTPEIAARFTYRVIGQTNFSGRSTYRIAFAPKNPQADASGVIDRLLNRVSGTLWIDSSEFEMARADITLGSEVNLLGGIAGSLKKLAYTMVRTRIGEGVWFNTLSQGDFQGRKLFDSTHIKTSTEVRGLERAS
jgi:hypothetical protein